MAYAIKRLVYYLAFYTTALTISAPLVLKILPPSVKFLLLVYNIGRFLQDGPVSGSSPTTRSANGHSRESFLHCNPLLSNLSDQRHESHSAKTACLG